MSVSDLLDDWFESDADQGDADRERRDRHVGRTRTSPAPRTSCCTTRSATSATGTSARGASSRAAWARCPIRSVAPPSRSARRSAPTRRVRKILVRGGRAVGVALENGDELRAPVVVSCIHPQIAFLDLIDRHELPADFVLGHRAVEDAQRRGEDERGALASCRTSSRTPGKNQQDHHTGSVELCFSPQYAERAFQDAHIERKAAVRAVRRRHDPDHARQAARARGGARLLDVHASGCPTTGTPSRIATSSSSTPTGSSTSTRSSRPNFKAAVIDRQVIGPYDMEQELGLIGGNIFHGELSVDQLFHMRPAPGYADYRTPITRAVPRLVRHARWRRRERHPRLAGLQHGEEGQGRRQEVAGDGSERPTRRPDRPRAHARGAFGRRRRRQREEGLARPPDDGRAAPRGVRRRDLSREPRLRGGPRSPRASPRSPTCRSRSTW